MYKVVFDDKEEMEFDTETLEVLLANHTTRVGTAPLLPDASTPGAPQSSDAQRPLSTQASSPVPSRVGMLASLGLMFGYGAGAAQPDSQPPAPPPVAPAAPPADAPATHRVLVDILHIFLRYEAGCTSKADPLFGLFMHHMMNAIFKDNEHDLSIAKTWLAKVRGFTPEQISRVSPQWFRRHVRRVVPEPKELAERVAAVYAEYQDKLKADGDIFFRQGNGEHAMHVVHAGVMKHILSGCLSDPPGVNLYYCVHETKDGLPTFRCVRSSSQLEGFHFHLRRIIRGYYSSPLLVDAILLSFVHSWNLTAAVRNKGNEELYTSCTELVDAVQTLSWRLFGTIPYPDHVCTPDVPDADLEPFGCQANPATYHDVRDSLKASAPEEHAAIELDAADGVTAEALLRLHLADDDGGDDDDPLSEPAVEEPRVLAVEQLIRKHKARTTTAVPIAADYHAKINNIDIPIAPVETSEEVDLFWHILQIHFPPEAITVDWSAIMAAYNGAVTARLRANANLRPVLRVKQSEHLIQYAESLHARYMIHRLNKERLPALKALHAQLKLPITCSIDWTGSAFEAFGKYNACPAGCTAVHAPGLGVLPVAAGLPIPALQPADISLTDVAMRKQWFEAAVAAAPTDSSLPLNCADVRAEINRLALAAGRPDLQYVGRKGYDAINKRLQRTNDATQAERNTRQRIERTHLATDEHHGLAAATTSSDEEMELPPSLQFAAGVAADAPATMMRRRRR